MGRLTLNVLLSFTQFERAALVARKVAPALVRIPCDYVTKWLAQAL
jgi:hypothetical protein